MALALWSYWNTSVYLYFEQLLLFVCLCISRIWALLIVVQLTVVQLYSWRMFPLKEGSTAKVNVVTDGWSHSRSRLRPAGDTASHISLREGVCVKSHRVPVPRSLRSSASWAACPGTSARGAGNVWWLWSAVTLSHTRNSTHTGTPSVRLKSESSQKQH